MTDVTIYLNDSLKKAIGIAQSLAKEYHNEFFYPAHLLRGLLYEDVGLKKFIESIGIDSSYIIEWAEVRIEQHPKVAYIKEIVTGHDGVKKIFEEADSIRVKLGLDSVSSFCAFVAIAKPGIAFSSEQLKSFPIKEKNILDGYFKNNSIQKAVRLSKDEIGENNNRSGALLTYCIERTELAKEGKTNAIIGRDKETRMMVEILCRKTKPNVLITGEAGVGKTALIDGLAIDIVNGKVPQQLLNSFLFELDLGALIARAFYKGEIEDRLKTILKELKQYPKSILFIDEIHILLDSKKGISGGIVNVLKPELSRGEITLIGATTNDEYRKYIEPDHAFIRRFEVLNIDEPDLITAEKILTKSSLNFEQHYSLTIDADAIKESVRFSKRYLKERRLPDVAIDLLDRTMAAIKLMVETNKKELEELQTEFEKITSTKEGRPVHELLGDYRWLSLVLKNKISPVLLGKLEDPAQTEKFESPEEFEVFLTNSFNKLLQLIKEKKNNVSKEDVASIISYKTGIPIGKIQVQEKERLLNMDNYLKRRVVGQDHAVNALSSALLESRSGLNKKGQPIGSFFFLGPTGTGKTELSKSLAEFLFNDEKAMIRFDMSEFKEAHSAALLYGAPPGYVGYEEGGMLVNKIRKKPYSVLLFDEIEKAHPSVFDTFLQILDEGHMHDRLGKEGDFSNSIIIFTSNIGSEWIAEQVDKGKIPESNKLIEIMTKHFRPEFLSRLTEVVPFAPINEENIVRIFEIQMKNLVDSLYRQGINFRISEEAKKYLASAGFIPKYGARQIAGVIRSQLTKPISKYIVSGDLKKDNTLKVDLRNQLLQWRIE